VRRAREAWPEIARDGEPGFMAAFVEYVAVRVPEGAPPEAPLGDLAIEDLFLAFACSRQHRVALRAFERELGRELAAALERLNVPRARRDDARQQIWEKLFVAAPRPRILDYSGRARLRTWFRVTVLRTLLDELRSEKRSREVQNEDLVLGAASGNPDPEIEHLKRLYRGEFNAAFEEAVRALSAQDRNTLRCYYAQSMTIDEIAAAFGIHRATAARRVTSARDKLLADTRRRLLEKLSLESRELDSIFRLIESRLHISMGRLLG